MGGEERVARQHARGRLTVRERIERLFDDGTFHERARSPGTADYDERRRARATSCPPTSSSAQGRIDGRRAIVQGDDFTVRGGAADAAIWQKMVYAERMAHDLRLPLVRLVDGTGGGGSVKTLETWASPTSRSLPGFEVAVENLADRAGRGRRARTGRRPRRGARRRLALLGDRAGTAQLFVAGPPVVAAAMGEAPDKEELGGARAQTRAGAVDNEADGRGRRARPARRFLSYLPDNVWEAPPHRRRSDPADRREEELLSIVPRDRRRPYKMRRILEAVLDRGSVFELGATSGGR